MATFQGIKTDVLVNILTLLRLSIPEYGYFVFQWVLEITTGIGWRGDAK